VVPAWQRDAASLGKRADIHVLVVGDPGMGKSQMLTAASTIAPRGVCARGRPDPPDTICPAPLLAVVCGGLVA
jgi:hypothetical protein